MFGKLENYKYLGIVENYNKNKVGIVENYKY